MRGQGLGAVMFAGLALCPVQAGDSGFPGTTVADAPNIFAARDFNAENPAVDALLGTYTVLTLKAAEIRLTATSPSAFGVDAAVNGRNTGRPFVDYVTVGAQVDWKSLVNLHAGIDLRKGHLRSEARLGTNNAYTTFTRPWIKAGIGYDIPAPAMSPFVRLEVAMAATKQSNPGLSTSTEEIRKAMAAEYEIGLYGGIRF